MTLLLCCLCCFSSGGLFTYCLDSWPCVPESSPPQNLVSCIISTAFTSIRPETPVCKIWLLENRPVLLFVSFTKVAEISTEDQVSWKSHILNCLSWVYHILLLGYTGYATWAQEGKRKCSQSIMVVFVVCGFVFSFNDVSIPTVCFICLV